MEQTIKIYMRKFVNLLLLVLPGALAAQSPATEDLLQYVHPIIGTQRMGHTYPGATSPFRMRCSSARDTECDPLRTEWGNTIGR